MNEQLSFEEAKRLSIIKWEFHVNYNGICLHLPKELDLLDCNCGFCERTGQRTPGYDTDLTIMKDCSLCEFGKVAGICTKNKSLFNDWFILSNKKLAAQKILDCIKQLKENS